MSSTAFPTHQGFRPISRSRSEETMEMDDIPLQKVVTGGSVTGARQPGMPSVGPEEFEKRPLRKKEKAQQNDGLTAMGRFYDKVLNFSLVTKYFIFVLPLAIPLAVVIVLGALVFKDATIGGVRLVWFFTWLEIVWLSLWICKIVAHSLPYVFRLFAGAISSKIRKYGELIKALEYPISFVLWAIVSVSTFLPMMIENPTQRALAKTDPSQGKAKSWETTMSNVLWAILVCTIIYFAERFLIQLITISYHNKQFESKIKESKRQIYLLSLLYEASKRQFAEYSELFREFDYVINDELGISNLGKMGSGAKTPMQVFHALGRAGDAVTGAVGRGMQEITGSKAFNSNTAEAIVAQCLERRAASEALANRIWISFVAAGSDALHLEDIVDTLGETCRPEAEEAFASLDRDKNGDVSRDEMILTVVELSRSRKSVQSSINDVDQAIKALHALLLVAVFVVSILVFIAFLNKSFTTTLATTGTAILSFSFVFATTCQEVLGSCIFLFVKHPYDIGDRVDLALDQFTVEHISLLYTVFVRVNTGKKVQIPNIVLNTLWVENISRSKAMREQISLFVNFDTSLEDVAALRQEMVNFVTSADNSREFQTEIDVDVIGIAEMNKLELRIECKHKSNWANETIRAQRRSKFMCALVIAIRKVPIYGPGGGGATLGSQDAPTYSVSVSPDDASKFKSDFSDTKEAKRLNPTKKPDTDMHSTAGSDYSGITAHHDELRAMQTLNARNPALDRSRDDAWATRAADNSNATNPTDERRSLEEVRGILHRESTRGRRQPNQNQSSLTPVDEPSYEQTYPPMPPVSGFQYASPPGGSVNASQNQSIPGNAFGQRRELSSPGSVTSGRSTNYLATPPSRGR